MSAIVAAMACAGAPRISLSNVTAQAVARSSATANASYSLENNGDIVFSSQVGSAQWIIPAVLMANYEVLPTVTAGSLSSGPTESWVNLATTRTWLLSRSGVGILTATLSLQIRRVSTVLVLASANIDFRAEVA